MSNFVPLHVHSHFSLLDGLSKPKAIAERCSELEFNSCAITDHGNLAGTVDFISACKKKDVKPILGCELYISRYDATMQTPANRQCAHLVVLSKNAEGWKRLISITSHSNKRENYYYKPRLSLGQLADFADGNLISFSGHMGSQLANVVFKEDKLNIAFNTKDYSVAEKCVRPDAASRVEKVALLHQDIFGKGNFFLEVQLIDQNNLPAAKIVSDILRSVSKKTGIPCVATCDAHYPSRADAIDQRVLLCSSLETTLPSINDRLKRNAEVELGSFFRSKNYHIPSYEDMERIHTEEELKNTILISDMCEEYNILREPMLPQFNTPDGMTSDDYLCHLCQDGWDKLLDNPGPEYKDRLEKELHVFMDAGLSGYFLIVQDIVNYGKTQGWLMGPGRGSAAGCLVSYLIGITSIDPIPAGLIFERFYNAGRNAPGRVSLPDIDVDVPTEKRQEIIDYIKDKYGHDKVAQMITFQRMQGRGAMKDVLRAHEACTFEEMNRLTKFIPDEAEIADQLQIMREETGEASIIQWALENNSTQLSEWAYLDDNGNMQGKFARYFEQAIRLEGTKSHQSKHAAGIVIASEPLHEVAPMVLDTKTGDLVAGYEMGALEKTGHVKFDILGVRMLDKIMGVQELLMTGRIS